MGSSDDREFRPEESLDLTEIYNISHKTHVCCNLRKVHFATRETRTGRRGSATPARSLDTAFGHRGPGQFVLLRSTPVRAFRRSDRVRVSSS